MTTSETASRPTWTLSGFGDEIDADPAIQASVLRALGAHYVEVRSAWGVNVLELSEQQLDELGAIFAQRGVRVSAIASPVGKVDVALPVSHEVDRLARAIDAAGRLQSRYVRIFSYFRAPGVPPEAVRDDVMTRMRALADLAESAGVILLHENEKEIYGDIPERIVDIVESVGSPNLRVAWDNANFVQVGVQPYTQAYALLRPYLEYVQIKDAFASTGEVTVAGDGNGELRETIGALRDDGYNGFVSLEPHLAATNALGGFSGPEEFGRAARAFRSLADALGVDLQ